MVLADEALLVRKRDTLDSVVTNVTKTPDDDKRLANLWSGVTWPCSG